MKLLRILLCLIFIVCAGPTSFANNGKGIWDSSFSFTSNVPPDQQALTALQKDTFSVKEDRRFNFIIPADRYCYVVIKAGSDTPASCRLSMTNTSLDTVRIYRLGPGGVKRLYEGGNLVKYDPERLYVWHTVTLEAGQTPAYYLIAVRAVSQNVTVDYQITPADKFQTWYRSFDRLVYSYAAFILLVSLTSLTAGLVFKRKALLIYAGYVLTLAGWILAHYGYLFAVLYPGFPKLNGVVKQVSSLVATLCLLQLITVSFKAELSKTWIKKTFVLLKSFTGLLIVFYGICLIAGTGFFNLTPVNILWNVSLLLSVCFIIGVLASLSGTSKTARVFSVAVSLVSAMAVFQSLSNMGWLYNYFLNEHGMLAASVLEVLLLTFGIIYNMWEEKTDRERELKIAEGERAKTLQMLISVQDEERKRIAGDLHDSIGPMLAAIKINFMRMAKGRHTASEELAAKTESIIDESIAEIRNIAHQLMPKSLSSKGLITLLADYFTDLEAVHSIRIQFTHEINVALDKEVQLNLYRMICELSLNAAKHSGAQTLAVSVKTSPKATVVSLKDDGTGFTKEATNGSSLGIKNVRSRVEYLKGTMQLQSSSDKGTAVEIIIPHKPAL